MNKKELFENLNSILENKISILKEAFAEKREDLLSESKSTAGDKHETGRAMIQLEQEKLSSQLVQLQKQRDMLIRINPKKQCNTVQMGALVETDKGAYFISTGLGQIKHEGSLIFAIAPTSPVAQAMLGKSVNDTFEFNSTKQTIHSIA
ncbi:Transcription elongation factor, GreA/GreB, C-term [Owenweeksia hongkongensis DSM 17368]|uniref:Transcription elongation factor, GreA/GreB, C-term n=1 Tax=Owenweeksia hongkongensis (strain DSM 17368 / CIP 108786 / JCM 12287 / NRRL B-23963 / UST20020801) TaxID=926562 RepID=G8R125_OWEHD|nr:GreA/GreB family elongation factor [Owenweeksia hongkongensis]AEV31696.1 Transcription elongation factor, GreA/GreB, C-term [Owenweeksia hongkongensis DSM 17368]